MKVILRKNFDSLGKTGEVVEVKDGYARNFLFVNKIALPATEGSIKRLEIDKQQAESGKKKEKKAAIELKEKIEALSCTITRKTEQENKIFGSVHSADIAEQLLTQGITIDKKKIEIGEPIKEFGVYNIPVKLYPEVEAIIKLWVVKE